MATPEERLPQAIGRPELDITGMSDDDIWEAIDAGPYGYEGEHAEADGIVAEFLAETGETRAAAIFRSMPKWFA